MSNHYDIAVLGAGPGGYVAALKAAQMGASVAIVEKEYLGGTCLNYGCIPSKSLLASAELLHHIQHAEEMGIEVEGQINFNWPKIQARKDKVVQTLRGGIKGLLGARKVTVFQGNGVLNGPGKLAVTKNGGPAEEFTADKTIIGVGSVPSRIPGWPTDPNRVATSDEALHWAELPKSLLIVGGGVIGCEFACLLRPFGVEVTIVEMLPQLLPLIDVQMGNAMEKIFTKRGIKCYTGTKIENLTADDNGIQALLSNGETIHAEKAMVATGRRPNTANIGLESIGLSLDRGFVRVNDEMETSVKGTYCIGDANGRCLLAHAASAHAVAAVENALGKKHSFEAPVPNCVYTFPEIGSVGATEQEARDQGLPISIGNFALSHLGRAMAANDTDGFVKVIRHRETDQLLGIHMLGHNATESIAAAGALLHQKVTVHEITETVFAHPTMSEAIRESAEDALSMGLHAPPRKVLRVAV